MIADDPSDLLHLLCPYRYVHTLKNENTTLATEIASAHARINQLESILSQTQTQSLSQPHLPSHASAHPQFTVPAPIQTTDSLDHLDFNAGDDHNLGEMNPLQTQTPISDFTKITKSLLHLHPTQTPNQPNQSNNSTSTISISNDDARTLIQTYYDHPTLGLPIIARQDILGRMNGMDGVPWDNQLDEIGSRGVELCLLLSIGSFMRGEEGDPQKGVSFWEKALSGMDEVLGKGDLVGYLFAA
jgi:hypothetical protein